MPKITPRIWLAQFPLVYDLKSAGALEIKFVAPTPEQIFYFAPFGCWGPRRPLRTKLVRFFVKAYEG